MARPKQFDREQALRKAMMLFWQKGYEATSVPDLLESMGISRSSLYEEYSDKRTLFREALQYYEQLGKRRFAILEQAESVEEGLKKFFDLHITMALDQSCPGGCFVTNTTVSIDVVDPEIQQLVSENAQRLNKLLHTLFKKGQKTGEISPDTNIEPLVSLFECILHGINVMVKVKKDRKAYDALVQKALQLIH